MNNWNNYAKMQVGDRDKVATDGLVDDLAALQRVVVRERTIALHIALEALLEAFEGNIEAVDEAYQDWVDTKEDF